MDGIYRSGEAIEERCIYVCIAFTCMLGVGVVAYRFLLGNNPSPLLVHNSKASIKQASKTRSLTCYYCYYSFCYDSTTARHARTHHPKTADSHTHRPTQSRGRPILEIRQRPQAQAAKTRSAPTHVLALQRGRVLSGYTAQYTVIVKYCTLVHSTYKHSVQKYASTAAISITYYHCHH